MIGNSSSLETSFGKKPSGLESLVNSSLGTAAIAASTALFGTDGLVVSASFPVGGFLESRLSSKPFTSKNFRDEAIAGALFTVPIWYGVNAMRQLPKTYGLDGIVNFLGYSIPTSAIAVGALSFAAIPLFNAIYYPIKYLVDKKTFKCLKEDLVKSDIYYKGNEDSAVIYSSVSGGDKEIGKIENGKFKIEVEINNEQYAKLNEAFYLYGNLICRKNQVSMGVVAGGK